MSRGGQITAPVGVMIAVMLLITVIVLIEPLKTVISIGSTSLDCSNPSLSVGQEMTCIINDMILPIFIGFGVAIAIAYFGIRDSRVQG